MKTASGGKLAHQNEEMQIVTQEERMRPTSELSVSTEFANYLCDTVNLFWGQCW